MKIVKRKSISRMKLLNIFIDEIQTKDEENLHEAALKALGRNRVRIEKPSLRTQVDIGLKRRNWTFLESMSKLEEIEEWFKANEFSQ